MNLFQIEGIATHLQVRRLKDAYIEGLPRVHQHPLPEVELALAFNAERTLNVLLNDFLLRFLRVSDNFSKLPGAVDTNAASVIARLDNPNVVRAIDLAILRHELLQLPMQSDNLDLFVKGK